MGCYGATRRSLEVPGISRAPQGTNIAAVFRDMKPLRLTALLVGAFLVGGGSAEVAVRTHAAVERARADREIGSAGQLVAVELHDGDGALIARPRLIAPHGRKAELVLHDPLRPGDVRVAFR